MLVNMESLFRILHCHHLELAIPFVKFSMAHVTIAFSQAILIQLYKLAVVFESKFIHFGIIRDCLKECPFNIVRCDINHWRICIRHQILSLPMAQNSFLYNFQAKALILNSTTISRAFEYY
jgi:hypothetical protein